MNENRGFLLKRYDSINLGIAVLLIWVSVTSLLEALYGEAMNTLPIFRVLQLCYLGAIFNAFPAIFKGKWKKSILVFLFFYFLIYIISSAFCDDKELEKLVFRNLYLWCWPYFILALKIKDFDLLFKTLKIVGYIAIICEIFRLSLFNTVGIPYSQETGYAVLISLSVFTLALVKEKKIYYILPVSISFLIILMSGSRGPLLCGILLFVIVFFEQNRLSQKTFFTLFIAFLVYFIYNIYRYEILTWLLELFSQMSVSTRSIELLLNNEIGEDNIRDALRNTSFQYALQHPFVGTGVLNDRVYLYKFGFITSATATVYGSYSHFFFAEVLMQFGLLPGCLLIFIFFKKIWYRIFKAVSVSEQNVFIISVTVGFLPLLVSRSWFTYQLFYLLLGILFSTKSKIKCQEL